MKLKKTLKYVFSFLLVLCMMCGLVGNCVPGGTVEAADNVSSYTVTTGGNEYGFFLGNKLPQENPDEHWVHITYTVQETNLSSATAAIGNNGVVQTHDPTLQFPYENGSMNHHNVTNVILQEGATYRIEIKTSSSDGCIGGRIYRNGERTYELDGLKTQRAVKGGNYFGIFIEAKVKATLTNVTCTDENGNDLGLQSNQSDCVIQKEAEKLMPTSYTVALNGCSSTSHFFLGNKTKTSGPITLTYTVSKMQLHSSGVNKVGYNGAIARSNATGAYPAADGLCSVYQNLTDNYLWKIGCTYTLKLGLDASGNLTFDGQYVDDTGKTTILSVAKWTGDANPSGSPDKNYQYFGIYYTSNLTGELINVTCTDASGKDLGLTSNQTGDYAIGVIEEQNPMVQEFTATKFANYRTNKTYPTAPDGYVFAGWYSDKTCTTALKADTIESTATAYAKYVDADVLSVKYQLPADVSSGDTTTTLRLVTTVDSLQYSFVGFQIYIGDEFIGAYKTKDVYEKITGTTDSTTVTYKPYVFSSESEYFMAVEITGVLSSVFNQTITVIPAWETLDGTVVMATGNARKNIVIADAIATLEQ